MMSENLQQRLLTQDDTEYISQQADWYLDEWKVPREKTFQRLNKSINDNLLFQVILLKGDRLIAAGGISDEVNLLDYCPEYNTVRYWLARVYTIPEERGKGYGADLCRYIQSLARTRGHKTLYLYTDTAENLYRRLGWELMEYASMDGRKVAVMKYTL